MAAQKRDIKASKVGILKLERNQIRKEGRAWWVRKMTRGQQSTFGGV